MLQNGGPESQNTNWKDNKSVRVWHLERYLFTLKSIVDVRDSDDCSFNLSVSCSLSEITSSSCVSSVWHLSIIPQLAEPTADTLHSSLTSSPKWLTTWSNTWFIQVSEDPLELHSWRQPSRNWFLSGLKLQSWIFTEQTGPTYLTTCSTVLEPQEDIWACGSFVFSFSLCTIFWFSILQHYKSCWQNNNNNNKSFSIFIFILSFPAGIIKVSTDLFRVSFLKIFGCNISLLKYLQQPCLHPSSYITWQLSLSSPLMIWFCLLKACGLFSFTVVLLKKGTVL